MSHIQEGLDQSPLSAKLAESEAYSNQTEGSQNGRPHFERFPMRIVTIPVYRDIPELVRNTLLGVKPGPLWSGSSVKASLARAFVLSSETSLHLTEATESHTRRTRPSQTLTRH